MAVQILPTRPDVMNRQTATITCVRRLYTVNVIKPLIVAVQLNGNDTLIVIKPVAALPAKRFASGNDPA